MRVNGIIMSLLNVLRDTFHDPVLPLLKIFYTAFWFPIIVCIDGVKLLCDLVLRVLVPVVDVQISGEWGQRSDLIFATVVIWSTFYCILITFFCKIKGIKL